MPGVVAISRIRMQRTEVGKDGGRGRLATRFARRTGSQVDGRHGGPEVLRQRPNLHRAADPELPEGVSPPAHHCLVRPHGARMPRPRCQDPDVCGVYIFNISPSFQLSRSWVCLVYPAWERSHYLGRGLAERALRGSGSWLGNVQFRSACKIRDTIECGATACVCVREEAEGIIKFKYMSTHKSLGGGQGLETFSSNVDM
jgi:hypothetical protein